jgi:hypothetical protein
LVVTASGSDAERMGREELITLLDRLGLTHPCDVDLLTFFGRYPRCLLTSESIAAVLGYEPKVIAESLDVLLATGVVTRTQTPIHAARLYELLRNDEVHPWLPPLLTVTASREGRLSLREALSSRPRQTNRGGPVARSANATQTGPRRLVASKRKVEHDEEQTG